MRNRTLAVLALTTAMLAAAPASDAQPARPAAASVRVSLMEWMVMRSPTSVRAGTVRLVIRNSGKQRHDLVVIRVRQAKAMLPMKGAVAVERGRIGKTQALAPGRSQTLQLRLAKGTYALICNLPGHYMAGMAASLRVS